MALLEVFFDPRAEEFVVDDGMQELGTRASQSAAKSLASQQASPGDTIQVFDEADQLIEEMLVDEDGELVSADIDGGQQGGGGGPLPGMNSGLPGMGGDNGGGLF
jgi:hypothetical protein